VSTTTFFPVSIDHPAGTVNVVPPGEVFPVSADTNSALDRVS
jgi:hypothetical protein